MAEIPVRKRLKTGGCYGRMIGILVSQKDQIVDSKRFRVLCHQFKKKGLILLLYLFNCYGWEEVGMIQDAMEGDT